MLLDLRIAMRPSDFDGSCFGSEGSWMRLDARFVQCLDFAGVSVRNSDIRFRWDAGAQPRDLGSKGCQSFGRPLCRSWRVSALCRLEERAATEVWPRWQSQCVGFVSRDRV